MSSNNENMDDAKSKIEKIRFDLEKKLAALEAAKIKNEKKITDSQIPENLEAEEPVEIKNTEIKTVKEEHVAEKPVEIKNTEVKTVKEERVAKEPVEIKNTEVKTVKEEHAAKEPVEIKNTEIKTVKEERVAEEPVEIKNTEVKTVKEEHVAEKPVEIKNTEVKTVKEEHVAEKPVKIKNTEVKTVKEEHVAEPVENKNIEVKTVKEEHVAEEKIEEKNKIIPLINETDNKKQDLIKEIVKLEDDFDQNRKNTNLKSKSDAIKNVNIVENKLKDNVETDATFFEINDVIENVNEKVENGVGEKKATISEVTPIVKKKKKKKKKNNKEKKSQNKKLTYLMYTLGGLVFLSIIFLSWNYLSKNSSKESYKDKTLSEYENRRYKDSIELADANNQLSDFQSQRYIDSIANANQIVLENDNPKEKEKPKKTKATPKKVNKKSPPPKALETVINNNLDNFISSNLTNDLVKNEENKEPETEPEKLEPEKLKPVKKPKIETLSSIEKSPIYPGCEKKGSEIFKKKCLMSKITKFVSNRFNTSLTQGLDLDKGLKRISVSFIIDRNGNVNVLKIRGQHKILEKEALRVVSSLPKMKPGRKNGKSEPITYTLPILYKIE